MAGREQHFGNLRNPNLRDVDVPNLGSKELDEFNEFQRGITHDLEDLELRFSDARTRINATCTSKNGQPEHSVH